MRIAKSCKTLALGAALLLSSGMAAQAQQVLTNASGIIRNSLCVGFDCPASISFDATTILLKENNLRIVFDDTSVAASFPRNDWQITANDRANGGANKFSIDDLSASRTPFTIEANAPSHSLYVDDGGRIGLGTSTPSTEIHTVDGDTPTLRLAQDGSSGFAPQTWDVAGNETSFFVRDATNGSTLPFRIFPGSPSGVLVVRDGKLGVNTTSPTRPLHVRRTDGTANILVEEASTVVSERTLFELLNPGPVRFKLSDSSQAFSWDLKTGGPSTDPRFQISLSGSGVAEFDLNNQGDLTIAGDVITTNCPTGCGPDFVFDDDYDLIALADLETFIRENRHLPRMPSAEEMEVGGLNLTELQLRLLEKVEELTLYTIQLERTVADLGARLRELEDGGPRPRLVTNPGSLR